MNSVFKARRFASLVIAAGLALSAGTGVATAAGANAGVGEVPQVKIQYSDLSTQTDQGARALYGRIKAAARLVCNEPGKSELSRFQQFHECQAEVTERAVLSVNQQALTSLHARLQASRKGGAA